jgi:hypothetical protein
MAEAFPSTHEVMKQRLVLLRQLAGSLELAHAALATTTPAKLELHTSRQRDLCRELQMLTRGFSGARPVESDASLASDLQGVARQVVELNRKYAALLRRRRRTVDIFCRVLASSGTTYPAPTLPSHSNGER